MDHVSSSSYTMKYVSVLQSQCMFSIFLVGWVSENKGILDMFLVGGDAKCIQSILYNCTNVYTQAMKSTGMQLRTQLLFYILIHGKNKTEIVCIR